VTWPASPARSRGNHERWTRSSNAGYMPAAARDALDAMERMASTGFNYGRLTRKGILWYFPTPSSACSTSTTAAR